MRVFLKENLKADEDDDHHHGTYHQEDHDSINTTMLAEPILNDTPIKTQVFQKKYSSLKDMISLMKTRYVDIYAVIFNTFYIRSHIFCYIFKMMDMGLIMQHHILSSIGCYILQQFFR